MGEEVKRFKAAGWKRWVITGSRIKGLAIWGCRVKIFNDSKLQGEKLEWTEAARWKLEWFKAAKRNISAIRDFRVKHLNDLRLPVK